MISIEAGDSTNSDDIIVERISDDKIQELAPSWAFTLFTKELYEKTRKELDLRLSELEEVWRIFNEQY